MKTIAQKIAHDADLSKTRTTVVLHENHSDDKAAKQLAHWAKWDGYTIMAIAVDALIDANFYVEAEKISQILKETRLSSVLVQERRSHKITNS